MISANVRTMRALVAKDLRMSRLPMLGLLIVGACAYLVAFAKAIANWSDNSNHRATAAMLYFCSAALVAIGLTSLLASVFGGVAIAGERSERSSDFLGLLPVTRRQIVLSKLTASALILCGCTVLHGTIALLLILLAGAKLSPFPWWVIATYLAWWLGFTMSFFGVGWFFSCFSNSGPISACASIAITVITAAVVDIAISIHAPSDAEMNAIFTAIAFSIGIISVIAGTFYYLKRVAP